MVFKSAHYRLGYGKNISGLYEDGKFVVYYKTRDGVVTSKIITRRAGHVELKKGDRVFNATSVLAFTEGYILARVDKEIRAEKKVRE